MQEKRIQGFSRLTKAQKLDWLVERHFADPAAARSELAAFWHPDPELQRVLDGFSENTVSNFVLPFGLAPNFLINGKTYTVPMVIEESSVVAAAASAAKFWMDRGGFKARVLSTRKVGQVNFFWYGDLNKLIDVFQELQAKLRQDAAGITRNMESRGGGVIDITLKDMTQVEPGYFQLEATFETCDSMGANFINSVLESFADSLQAFIETHTIFSGREKDVEVIMAILSNYTPECIVRAEVACPVEQLAGVCENMSPALFAERFRKAIRIAEIDPFRAATHNKGIYNGVDAVVLATGNDFRAVEACGHTYAARNGKYASLSHCEVQDGQFRFWLDLPLALGTVGGLTGLHPLARRSLELLGAPSATELMEVIAATGLAQNFAAVRSLVTTGIQKGHMKMHLMNILNHLGASVEESNLVETALADRVISFTAVRDQLELIRNREGSRAKSSTT